MKTKIYLLGLLAVIMSFASCENDLMEPDIEKCRPIAHKSSKLQKRVIRSRSLVGNFIGNTPIRKMQVYTPPGYTHRNKRGYPVVYLLHGLPFSEDSFIDEQTWDPWINPDGVFKTYPDFPAEGFRVWIDNLIEEGKIEPMIIVMPNAENNMYGFSFYTNSALNGNFEDYITKDLVKYIDRRFNTITRKKGRAIIGYSQGGYAAFKFGMKHPDIFGTVASHSGLLVVDTMLSLGPYIQQENPDGFTGPHPNKFLTSAGYGMSSAWSPNLNKPPFYVDLPFEFNDDGDVVVVSEVRDLWWQHDIFTLIDTHSNALKSLNGIYFDVGIYDELAVGLDYPKFIAKLNNFGIDHTFETFEGGHFNQMYSRLATSLMFFSDQMRL